MSWQLFRWVWQLEAPLYVGMPPSGSLNRCRLYVPARALWGALTARIAQERATSFPEYATAGEEISRDVRLTYLYPSEQPGSGWCAWLPRYQGGKGLNWLREDESDRGRSLTDRALRLLLLVARPGTAIDPASDAAAEGTLRETEGIGQYWRDGNSKVPRSVGFTGYVLVREGATVSDQLSTMVHLVLGGDTRYGLGRMRLMARQSAADIFGDAVDLAGPEPSIQTDRVLAHAHAPTGEIMCGQLEALGGWDRAHDRGFEQLAPIPLWTPGSLVANHKVPWTVQENGYWQRKSGEA